MYRRGVCIINWNCSVFIFNLNNCLLYILFYTMIIAFVTSIEEMLQKINVVNFEIDILILLIYYVIFYKYRQYLCIPLGLIFNTLRCKNQRIVYNLFFGLFFTMVITKEWFTLILLWAIVIFFVSRMFKKCFLPVFIVAFSIMSYCHIYRLMVWNYI